MWRVLKIVLGGVVLGLTACGPGDPLAATADAKSESSWGRWQQRNAGGFAPELAKEFEAALQDIRLAIMAERAATGREGIEAELRRRVDGRTLRELLILGYTGRRKRLAVEEAELHLVRQANGWLVTKPGDTASARSLGTLRERQERRAESIAADMAAAARRLTELGATPEPILSPANATGVTGKPLPRAEARVELATMLAELQAGAALKHGSWPVKIDRTGAQLPAAEQAAFRERQAAAAAAGRVLLAVGIKDRWLRYEAALDGVEWPAVVATNLTPEERLEFTMLWHAVQAELWARRETAER